MMRTIPGLAAAVLAAGLFATEGRADFDFKSQYQGGTSVNVVHSLGSGTVALSTSAGPFKATPISPSGSPFDAYCVSLNISVGNGPDNIKVSSIQSLHSLTNTVADHFEYSGFTDVGNRLEFLLNKYGATGDKDALALAVWYTIDKKFSYTGGNPTLNANYAAYIDFAAAGYVSGTVYNPNAKLLVVNQSKTPYQNLIGITAVPEPASIVMAGAGLGAIGLIAVRRGRRKDS